MLSDNFAFLSNYICRESIRNLNKHLSSDDLESFSNNDYFYLTTIHYLGSPNYSQLAEELNMTKPAVTNMVNKLIKLKLIEKVQSLKDKRVFYIHLTEKGKLIVNGDEELYKSMAEMIRSLVADDKQYAFVDKLMEGMVLKLIEHENSMKNNAVNGSEDNA